MEECMELETRRKGALIDAWTDYTGRFVDMDDALFCTLTFAKPHSLQAALDYHRDFIRRLMAEGAHRIQSVVFIDHGRESGCLHDHSLISGYDPLTPKEVERLWHRGLARVEAARGPGAQRYLAAKAVEGIGFDAVFNNRIVIQDALMSVLADGRPRTFLEIGLSLQSDGPHLDHIYSLPGPVIQKNLGRLIASGHVQVATSDDGRRRWGLRQ
jgi:hypothetical protein